MLDEIDYKEPACLLCGGEDFYNPDNQKPQGSIPIVPIIEKLDAVLAKNNYAEGERLLCYWLEEAKELHDKRGELEILSEQMGFYRKIGNAQKGLESVTAGLALISELGLQDTVSGATIALNGATTYKAFGKAQEAVPIYESVVEIYKKFLKPDDKRFAGLYNNFALALKDIGKLKDSEAMFKSALEVLSHSDGNENECAITYVNLAHLYDEQGDLITAESCLEKAIMLLNSENIEHNGYHAFVISKCLTSLDYFGYFLDKATLEKRMNEIYERS